MADASAFVEYILRTERSAVVEQSITAPDADLHVPALCDVGVASALRRALMGGVLSEVRAGEALHDYLDLSITRHGHQNLLARVLDLRENFSAYDATYVALAERLHAELLTGDASLAKAVRANLGLRTVPLSP